MSCKAPVNSGQHEAIVTDSFKHEIKSLCQFCIEVAT